MADFGQPDFDIDQWIYYYNNIPNAPSLPYEQPSMFCSPLDTATVQPNMEYASPESSQSASDTSSEERQLSSGSRKRARGSSEDSQPEGTLKRERKPRKLANPKETAKVREKGACFLCQKKRKVCQDGTDPEGSCKRCLEQHDKVTVIPGLLRPLCWRPNIGSTEIFRRGPTIDFALSLRGNSEDAGPGKQALWKTFVTRISEKNKARMVELSQGWAQNTLTIRLDPYQPMEKDKQFYTWFDDGVERQYRAPAFAISSLGMASSAIEKFLGRNADSYIKAHLRAAAEITRTTFETAQKHKYLPLVERALKLWVACRFIEEPWSIVGNEKLGMAPDPNPNSPYHTKVPVPPIVDLQIDLVVINEILQPELKKILKMMKEKLESTDPWTDWFEIYLAYFIMLHNVELTMAHDAWFVKRNNLKKRFSNKPLIDTITLGATTLLTCFHYAHQGFAPFTNPDLASAQQWPQEQLEYLGAARPLLRDLGGDYVQDPARELFWTSQLHRPDWRPVVLIS